MGNAEYTIDKMADGKEVQAHGLKWEDAIKRSVFQLTDEDIKKIKYTGKLDIPIEYNKINDYNVSIKTTGNPKTVCMADCLRLYDMVNSDEPYRMITVVYKQDSKAKVKRVVEVSEVDLTSSKDVLFGSLTRADVEELDKAVKSVPQNRKPTKEEHTAMYAIQNRLKKNSGAIYLNIKCNSTQSRLQCSFNAFQKFLTNNPSRVIQKSATAELYGVKFLSEILSGPRVFKGKL
jgi:hypothetical protein